MKRGFVAVLILLLAAPVAAQEAPPRGVQRVFVLSSSGDEVEGHLLQLGPSTLTMLVDGTRRELPLDSIQRVETPGDSVKNGALIGGVVGFVWCALICGQAIDDGGYVAILLFNTALFASLGTAIDASIAGRATIYSKPLPTAAAAGSVRPVVSFRLRF